MTTRLETIEFPTGETCHRLVVPLHGLGADGVIRFRGLAS